MNKREYLRSLGFRVGERGRFTDEQKTSLAMFDGVFEEDQPKLKIEKVKDFGNKKAAPVFNSIKQREARTLSGYTKEGYQVGFVMCAKCNQHMIWCGCELVQAPSIVVRSNDSLVRIP